MSQKSRPMVAGGRSSDQMTIGGFRRLFSSPAALPARMVGRGERGGDGGPSWARAAVRRWRDGGGRRGDFPTGTGSGRRTEEKEEEKERRKRKGLGLGLPPPAQLSTQLKNTHYKISPFYLHENFTIKFITLPCLL